MDPDGVMPGTALQGRRANTLPRIGKQSAGFRLRLIVRRGGRPAGTDGGQGVLHVLDRVVAGEGQEDLAVRGDDVAGPVGEVGHHGHAQIVGGDERRRGGGDGELEERHSLTENSARRETLSAVMPITEAPAALKSSMAAANSCASTVQPEVKAAGKK